MIPEEQQEQAALYALDSLSAADAATFERTLASSGELQQLVRELRDAAASLALTVSQQQPAPSAALKQRVMEQVAAEFVRKPARPQLPNVITPPASAFHKWLPWAIAAGLAIFCGVLAVDRARLEHRLAGENIAPAAAEPLLVALAPAEGAPAKAQAVVAWNSAQQIGAIKISNLPVAEEGKDYQLWAVDAAQKDPISAGVLHFDAKGKKGQIQFKPVKAAHEVKAFAISLEVKGGVAKREGPILLIGAIGPQ